MSHPRDRRIEVLAPKLALAALGLLVPLSSSFGQKFDGRLQGVQPGQRFGSSVCGGVDLDGDGIQDFAIGSPGWSDSGYSHNGLVQVYSGATRAAILVLRGNSDNELFGYSVLLLPDIDGDGFGEVCASAEGWNSSRGSVTTFSGKTGSPLWAAFGSTASYGLGASLAPAGDVDRDGKADVVAGTFGDAAELLRGADGSQIHTWSGSAGNGFGSRVAGGIDVDGDRIPDVVVAEPFYDQIFPPKTNVGRVHVYSGDKGKLLFSLVGDSAGDELGFSVALLHDLDGDRNGEIAVGGLGLVKAFSSKGSVLYERDERPTDFSFGRSLCTVKDVSLDGKDDLAIGGSDILHLVSGTDGSELFSIVDLDPNVDAFAEVIGSSDLDADGHGDLLICAPFSTVNGQSTVGLVDAYLTLPATHQSYGAGWPGTNGIPSLTSTDPGIGENVTLSIGNSRGSATLAFLLIGFQEISVPTSADGTLLVLPTFLIKLLVPTAGLDLLGAIANDPHLLGLELDLQALELDPGASKGLSFTRGLRLTIGFDYP